MPATNWREVTYSRRHLRPNDGQNPEVKQLLKNCRTLGRTGRCEDYDRAKQLLEEAGNKKMDFEEFLRKEEEQRQLSEKKKCAEAFKLRIEEFNEEWDQKHVEMEAECEKNVADFEEIAAGRRKALELHIKRTPMKPVVYSSEIRDYKLLEKKCADCREFEMAKRYNRSIEKQTREEQERHIQKYQNMLQRKRADLEEELARLKYAMEDKNARARLQYDFDRKTAYNLLCQRNRNLQRDVDHAHAREYIQPREVRASLSRAYRSRPRTCATFHGRSLLEHMGHGALDLPSVSRAHFSGVPSGEESSVLAGRPGGGAGGDEESGSGSDLFGPRVVYQPRPPALRMPPGAAAGGEGGAAGGGHVTQLRRAASAR